MSEQRDVTALTFDPHVRVAEIKAANREGDVSWVDIDWLCDVALAAADTAVLRHGHHGMRVQSNGHEHIPRYKLVKLRETLGMPRG